MQILNQILVLSVLFGILGNFKHVNILNKLTQNPSVLWLNSNSYYVAHTTWWVIRLKRSNVSLLSCNCLRHGSFKRNISHYLARYIGIFLSLFLGNMRQRFMKQLDVTQASKECYFLNVYSMVFLINASFRVQKLKVKIKVNVLNVLR